MYMLFIKCVALGFSIAMILGPIGILCIQQTITHGFGAGMAVGLGASLADGIFAALGGIGLTLVTNFLVGQQFWLQLIGGLFLCYLGIQALRRKPSSSSHEFAAAPTNLLKLFFTTFLLTLTNPVTIISFSAMLAAIDMTNPGMPTLAYGFLLFSSFFIGSAMWWVMLSGTLSTFRTKISSATMQRINLAAGVILIGFGLMAIIKALL